MAAARREVARGGRVGPRGPHPTEGIAVLVARRCRRRSSRSRATRGSSGIGDAVAHPAVHAVVTARARAGTTGGRCAPRGRRRAAAPASTSSGTCRGSRSRGSRGTSVLRGTPAADPNPAPITSPSLSRLTRTASSGCSSGPGATPMKKASTTGPPSSVRHAACRPCSRNARQNIPVCDHPDA